LLLHLSIQISFFLFFKTWNLLYNRMLWFNLVSMNIMVNRWFRYIRLRKLFLLNLNDSIFWCIQYTIFRLLKEWFRYKLGLSNLHSIFIICERIFRDLIFIVIEINDSSKFILTFHYSHQSFIFIWLKLFVNNLESITNSVIFSL
jgi:hypothetical protein